MVPSCEELEFALALPQEATVNPIRIAVLALAFGLTAGAAGAQGNASPPWAAGPTQSMPMHHGMGMQGRGGMGRTDAMPVKSGQAAFGAIQEIVRMLQADPMTNWSKVDIDVLRQHMIDMDEVTLRADAQKQPIDKGLRIAVTGSGRTLEAIQRMVPAHAQDIDGLYGWSVQAKPIENGEELTVTTTNAADVQKIRALGFMGIMVLGTHQMHHMAMARGEMMPPR